MTLTLTHAETRAELHACFDVIRQLRPQLSHAEAWYDHVLSMRQDGYRVLVCRDDEQVLALAGYRLQTNLVHGRFLFVNDLVTGAGHRGQGLGARLLRQLDMIAGAEGCSRLVLDTAMANHAARSFYTREGLEEVIVGFVRQIGQAA
ncbi:GNAT family N-acetyltransferase [Novosphingobium terrae]|uniref:GNAT family N-acetyltransferase n=1 Tax=Novosphingobium terrae TaxID=2726189 RepID=UPI001981A128|nr:GNAT family N-acetyltransferase [Novosphingobium terrae]